MAECDYSDAAHLLPVVRDAPVVDTAPDSLLFLSCRDAFAVVGPDVVDNDDEMNDVKKLRSAFYYLLCLLR